MLRSYKEVYFLIYRGIEPAENSRMDKMKKDLKVKFIRLKGDRESIRKMRDLNALFAEVFEDEESYLEHSPSDSYLQRFLNNKNHIICVGETENQIVGGLAAYVLEKFEKEGSEVYIYDLGVKEEFRRRKIATELIQFLQEEIAETSAGLVFVQADKADQPAIRLYESLGEKEEVLHFDLRKD